MRARIDAVDGELLSLLERRADLVVQIARLKASHRLEAHDPRREAEILERLAAAATGRLSAGAVIRIFRAVLTTSLELHATTTEPAPEDGPLATARRPGAHDARP